MKPGDYAKLAALLAAEANIRKEDVAIAIVENTREDWSFGNGIAQYVVLPKQAWK